MKGKLTLRQNEVVSEAVAQLSLKLLGDPFRIEKIVAFKRFLTIELLSVNDETDFQGVPTEIPAEWLREAEEKTSANLVEILSRQGTL